MKGSNKKYWGTFFSDGAIRLSLCKSHSDMVILYWQLIATYVGIFFNVFSFFNFLEANIFPLCSCHFVRMEFLMRKIKT